MPVVEMSEGFKLCPVESSYLLRAVQSGTYERDQTAEIKTIIKRGWTFLDVGAGIGYYSMFAARRGCQVFAFEPSAANYAAVGRAIRVNKMQASINAFHLAVGEKRGAVSLGISPANDGDNRIVAPETWPREKCYAVTLDSMIPNCAQFGRVFLKIDVQGSELSVLRGAARLLADYRPVILAEDSMTHLRDAGEKSSVRETLTACGYVCKTIGQRRNFCDLLCVPLL